MPNTSIYLPDELVEAFDDAVFERKVTGEIERDASRSEVIRMLMQDFIDEQNDEDNQNSNQAAQTAD